MGAVTELVELLPLLENPWNLLWLLLLFGIFPGLLLRLIVLIYPKGHPRRHELIAELYAVPWHERLLFVAQQLETAACEGIPERVSRRRRRKKGRSTVPPLIADDLARLLAEHDNAVIQIGSHLVTKNEYGIKVRTFRRAGAAARMIDYERTMAAKAHPRDAPVFFSEMRPPKRPR